MASNKRRRLYEGFGLLEEKSEDNHEIISGKSYDNHAKKEDGNLESHDNPMTNLTIDMGKSYDNHAKSFNWFEFSKLQQNILLFIHKNCVFNASLATNPIRISEFESALKTSPGSIRKTIYNLIQMKALKRESFKDGPGGWSKFVLTKEVYDLIGLESEKNNNLKKILGLSYDNHRTNHEKIDVSSSINDLNNKTITTEETFMIPENLKALGIGQKQLSNIKSLNVLSADEIQGSLDHYSFDLSNGLKPNLNLLMGVLRKGSVYISQKYSLSLNDEIQREIQRIELAKEQEKQLKQNELFLKFQEFKKHNPEWYQELKSRQRFEVSSEIFENLAFQEWKMINE